MKLKLYMMEAAGLAIFMVSACFFSAQLDNPRAAWYHAIPNGMTRHLIEGAAMGVTALLIFYLPFTAPSGSHINPAVTLAFLRVKRISKTDALFYICFQTIGGLLAVYLMTWVLKDALTASPVNYAVTRPGKSVVNAAIIEFMIGFIMMTMVLNLSSSHKYSKYTRLISGCMVTTYVISAGPISGFGMNPARSLASAIPSGIYTSFWIYIILPIASMWLAAELFLYTTKSKTNMKRHFKYHWAIILIPFLLIAAASYSQVKQVESVGMTVSDLNKSISFYHTVLNFERIKGDVSNANSTTVRMKLGDEVIALTAYRKSKGRAIPKDMKSNDLYFQHIAIVVSNMDSAYAILNKHMTGHISNKPQTIPVSNVAAAGVKAFYFHDPDNHDLELIYFPKGKGQPKWQQTNGKLFLGIDHTAIGVSNTDQSLHFYKDILGFERKGDSWNKGMEQMDLSNVKGASLHITGLRTSSGPGIEFLQYLQPGPGKSFPKDTKIQDIWYWQVTVIANDVESLYKNLKDARFHFLIPIKSAQSSDSKKYKYFIVQDPDGHALMIKD